MKKYVFIALFLIFGTSICSNYMNYKSTNPKNEIIEDCNPQNIVQNVDIVSQNEVFEEQEISLTDESDIDNNGYEKIIERSQIEEIILEPNSDVKPIQEQPISEVKEEKLNINNNNTPQITKEENIQEKSEITKQEDENKQENQVTEKKQCNGNYHGVSVGNSGKWFDTEKEAIDYYYSIIKTYGDQWENFEIDDETYKKKCPYGYQDWSCPYCGKWTIDFYYNKY